MSVEHAGVKKQEEDEESETTPPPDGGWGWMVVLGSFMIHIITDGVTYSFGVFYNEFLEYFREGNAATTWIHSILVGVTLCSGPLSSSLVNRWGCRAVTIAGAILASICLFSSMWANSVKVLYLTIGLGTGIGFGLIYLPAIVSVTTYFEKKRSLATGIAVCGAGIGTFVFAPIINKLLFEYGWRGSMVIISGLVLECILFGSLFRPLENEPCEQRRKCSQASPAKLIPIKTNEAKTELHASEYNLNALGITEEHREIQRPHSVGHFSMPRTYKIDHQKGSRANGNLKAIDGNWGASLSQPMLAQVEKPKYQHFGSHQNVRKHGPLDKPDVFYQGSLMNIPSYRSRLNMNDESAFLERRHSTLSRKRRQRKDSSDESTTVCGVVPCSQETKDTLREMMDLSLFKDPIFIVFTISNFLTSIGFNVPYLYIVPKANKLGLTSDEASMLISIIGIANTIGRIILGYISDKPWINRLLVYNWCLTICGIATILSAFCPTFITMSIYASVFGFTIGAYVGLTSVILVDLLGLDRLTNAFGLLLLFQGVASLVGPPMAGGLSDWSKSYDPGFYLAGITITLSGVVLFAIPPLQRRQEKRQLRQMESVGI